MQITKEHLEFLEEAKKVFESDPRYKTHRNDEETLIALRRGADEDCIQIYELGQEVAFFAQYLKQISPRKQVLNFSIEMEKQLAANDHKHGWGGINSNYCIDEIIKNTNNLQKELCKQPDYQRAREITRFCANIGNFSMMIMDNNGVPR